MVREVRKGTMQIQFDTLIEEYSDLVFSVCLRITGDYFESQDLTQETFISAFSHGFSDIDNPKAWLCRIATNKCLDWIKKKKPVPLPDDSIQMTSLPEERLGPEEDYIQEETNRKLTEICEKLKEPYRQTALWHFVCDLSAEEIAQKQNSPPATVRTRIFRARKMMQKIWKEEER